MICKQLPNAMQYNKDGAPIDAFNGNGGSGGSSSPQNDYVERSDLANVAFTGDYDDLNDKPILGTAAAKDVPASGNASTTQVVMGNDSRLSDSRPASDVFSWAKASTKPSYTKSEVGLGNVGNFKAVSTAASQGLTNTEKSNAKANIGLDNVDNTSDATKKTNFTGGIGYGNTGFVTGGAVYNELNNRYKSIKITNNNYNSNLFNDVRPGDFVELNLNDLGDYTVNIYKCNHCFIKINNTNDLFKLNVQNDALDVHGNIDLGTENLIIYVQDYRAYVLSTFSRENILRIKSSSYVTVTGHKNMISASGIGVLFDSDHPLTKVTVHIYNKQDVLLLKDNIWYQRQIYSFGDIQYPTDATKCSTFGFFPLEIIKRTNSTSWEELFVGCGFHLDNNYIINPSTIVSNLKKAFYYAYSYNSHMTNVDLSAAIGTITDLTSCFEHAEYFNVILDGVDLTNNTCTDMFKDAKNITISAIGCNQDTIDKINANISGSYTSTITVITTDPNA